MDATYVIDDGVFDHVTYEYAWEFNRKHAPPSCGPLKLCCGQMRLYRWANEDRECPLDVLKDPIFGGRRTYSVIKWGDRGALLVQGVVGEIAIIGKEGRAFETLKAVTTMFHYALSTPLDRVVLLKDGNADVVVRPTLGSTFRRLTRKETIGKVTLDGNVVDIPWDSVAIPCS